MNFWFSLLSGAIFSLTAMANDQEASYRAERALYAERAATSGGLGLYRERFGPTYYEFLGVQQEASPEEIKEVIEIKVRSAKEAFSGPKNSSLRKLFLKKLEKIREVLLNPEERKKYDGFLETFRLLNELSKPFEFYVGPPEYVIRLPKPKWEPYATFQSHVTTLPVRSRDSHPTRIKAERKTPNPPKSWMGKCQRFFNSLRI